MAFYCENRTGYTCQKAHYMFVTNITWLMFRVASGASSDVPIRTRTYTVWERFHSGTHSYQRVTQEEAVRSILKSLSTLHRVSSVRSIKAGSRFTFLVLSSGRLSAHSVMELLRVSTVQCVWCVGSTDVDLR